MDKSNDFLNSYKNNMEKREQQREEPADAVPHRYEEKSAFIKPKKREAAPAPDKRPPKWALPAGIAAVAVLAVLIALLFLLNNGVEAMNFIGWTQDKVGLWARENGVTVQFDEAYNDEYEAGKVVSQSVGEGASIRKGGLIDMTVSLGHDPAVRLPLPDIMSMTNEEIEAWAAENYMTKVRITAEYSETVPSGRVIRYEINDDTVVDEVSRNTPIYVVVSKGREDESTVTVTVPNFKEMALSECYLSANENGLILHVVEQHDDYVPKGAIIAQSVKADEKVKKGTEIELIVSKGKMIAIPGFAGYSKEKATAVASELGIPATIREKYSGKSAGAFISQSIEAGSIYEEGDILELCYSLGNKIVISSFVGQTRDAIENWAGELNDQGAKITVKTTHTQSNSPKGTIVCQDKANTVTGITVTIRITVSKGKVVFMPDFVAEGSTAYDTAFTREKALTLCEQLNIVPVFKKASKKGFLPGAIWYQSEKAGGEIAEGATVTLKYTPANETRKMPDFVGMTKEEAGAHYVDFYIVFEEGAGDPGIVCGQSVPENTTVARGSTVLLTLGAEEA